MRLKEGSLLTKAVDYSALHAIGFGSATALVALALLPSNLVLHGPVLCPFKALIGLDCPTCGLTRSVYNVIHGDFSEAYKLHALGGVVAGALTLWACDLVPISSNAWKRLIGHSQSAVIILLVGNWLGRGAL